jgi:5-methyltetrahydrofolate--homocysteine methyltransferase
MLGVTPAEAAAAVRAAGGTMVGAICGTVLDPDGFAGLAGELAAASNLPVMIQPNAGPPRLEGGRAVYDLSGAAFAEGPEAVILAGAAIVGGCCGTGPEHIRALRALVDNLQRRGQIRI